MSYPSPTVLCLSTLPHTWLIDMDGVVGRHNAHLEGEDVLLPGAREFWDAIPADDSVILLSARGEDHRDATLAFMSAHGLRVDRAIFGLPVGERVLINDIKPSGLKTALGINLARNAGLTNLRIEIDQQL